MPKTLSFGTYLRVKRKMVGMTATSIEDATERRIHCSKLSQIENGHRSPRLRDVDELAALFGEKWTVDPGRFGAHLRTWRKRDKVTAGDIYYATKKRFSPCMISWIETGKSSPRLDDAQKLASMFGKRWLILPPIARLSRG